MRLELVRVRVIALIDRIPRSSNALIHEAIEQINLVDPMGR